MRGEIYACKEEENRTGREVWHIMVSKRNTFGNYRVNSAAELLSRAPPESESCIVLIGLIMHNGDMPKQPIDILVKMSRAV